MRVIKTGFQNRSYNIIRVMHIIVCFYTAHFMQIKSNYPIEHVGPRGFRNSRLF